MSGARLLTSWRVELPPLQSPSFKGWLTNNPSKGGQLTSRAVYTASAITTSIINMTLEKSCRYFIDSAWQKSMHLEASVESTLSTTAVILVRFTSEETCFCFHVQYWALGTDHFLMGCFWPPTYSAYHKTISIDRVFCWISIIESEFSTILRLLKLLNQSTSCDLKRIFW